MLAIVCLELMVYVMPGDYLASRVKLLRFSIQQPLIDELISLTHTKEQLHNLFFKYLSTRSSDAGITLRLFGSQSLRLFYQFGVNSLNQSLQHYRLAVFDFSIHFFSRKDNQKVALFKVYCKTIENFIAHLKYMEISCGVYNFLVMHWKLDFALVSETVWLESDD